jgi:CheY-like chemotaxis protein
MRPKKVILYIDGNEQSLSVRSFLLETRGYRVKATLSPDEAQEMFAAASVDLVLCELVLPATDGNELVRKLKSQRPEVPMLLISNTVKAFERASYADAFLPKGACSSLELLERIRVMMARKRGPRKQISMPSPLPSTVRTIDRVVEGMRAVAS